MSGLSWAVLGFGLWCAGAGVFLATVLGGSWGPKPHDPARLRSQEKASRAIVLVVLLGIGSAVLGTILGHALDVQRGYLP